jgi:hypothetical protein
MQKHSFATKARTATMGRMFAGTGAILIGAALVTLAVGLIQSA